MIFVQSVTGWTVPKIARRGRDFIGVIDFALGGFGQGLNPPYKLHAWTAQNVGWIKAFGRIHQKL
jgi:hypothetical protein